MPIPSELFFLGVVGETVGFYKHAVIRPGGVETKALAGDLYPVLVSRRGEHAVGHCIIEKGFKSALACAAIDAKAFECRPQRCSAALSVHGTIVNQSQQLTYRA